MPQNGRLENAGRFGGRTASPTIIVTLPLGPLMLSGLRPRVIPFGDGLLLRRRHSCVAEHSHHSSLGCLGLNTQYSYDFCAGVLRPRYTDTEMLIERQHSRL
jgi:hypothetical protein